MSAKSDDTAATIAELRKHNESLRGELKQFNAELAKIKKKNEEALAAARSEAKANSAASSKPESEEIKRLQAEIASCNQKMTIMMKTNADLRKAYEASGPERIKKLQSEITAANAEKHQMKVEISTLKNEVARMRSTAFALVTEEDKKNQAYQANQLKQSQQKAAEYKKQMEQTERNARKQQEALVEATQKVQNLSTNPEVKQRLHSELELHEKIQRLEAEIAANKVTREEERLAQSNIVQQFQRKITVLEFTVTKLREQMKEGKLEEKEIVIPKREPRAPAATKTANLRQTANMKLKNVDSPQRQKAKPPPTLLTPLDDRNKQASPKAGSPKAVRPASNLPTGAPH